MSRCCLGFTFLLLPGTLTAAEPTSADAEKLAAVARKAWDVPGLAIAIVRGDETLVLKGFGQCRLGEAKPITPDTVFPLASCSKAFTTTLLAMLVDDGVMGWDDPVRKDLPGFKLSDPSADALVTIRDLLCHRTGIAGHDLLWYRAPWGIDEVLKRAALLPLEYPFRGGYRYSSIPFLVAGRAIEHRTGEKWEKLVRTRICDPLGMTGVAFTTTGIPRDAIQAGGHRIGKDGKVEPMAPYVMREPNPAGSVHATARDLAAWLKFHLAEGINSEGKRIVSMKNLEETHVPHNVIRLEGIVKVLNPDTVQLSYAMGWLVYDYRGKKVISHGGMVDGFRVQLTFLPEENLGFVVLGNLHETRMNAALTNSLIDLYCGLPAKDWNGYFAKVAEAENTAKKNAIAARNKARDPDAKPSLPPTGYVGEYGHPVYGTARVTMEGTKLQLAWSNFPSRLEHFEGDVFRITNGFFEEQLVTFGVIDGKAVTLRFASQEFRRK